MPEQARRLGRYPVTGELGIGGMGQVLLVYDEQMGREVAAKVLLGSEPRQLAKFVLEARVTGQLEHPSIVPAYEMGRTSDGRMYFTMKRVAGEELGGPVHRVRLAPFFLAKTELTQSQWVKLGGENRSFFRADTRYRGSAISWRHPLESVSWQQCADVLARHGLVLPTSAQWEAAARGGTTGARWSALRGAENIAGIDTRKAVGSVTATERYEDGHPLTAPVGSLKANPFGLFDVLGNVEEWCRDAWSERAYRRPADPLGHRPEVSGADRVVRGGHWACTAPFARSGWRHHYAPSNRTATIGCRPARLVRGTRP